MEVLVSKMGYKKGEKLKFLNKGICGIWLIWIGFVTILATFTRSIFGVNLGINPAIFVAGYFGGRIVIYHSNIFSRFSYGKNSEFQKKIANLSILLMFVIMSLISPRYFGIGNYRMIWLGSLLAVGIHFIPFSIVHGKLSLCLSVALTINALIGIFDLNVSFFYIAIIDGVIKEIFGIILFMNKKPQEN
jgi:hypothetical protein